jgi:hypothetical protein
MREGVGDKKGKMRVDAGANSFGRSLLLRPVFQEVSGLAIKLPAYGI